MGIKRFEEIQAWQEARGLVRLVYEATRDARFAKDYGFKEQIQRSAVSVMANIAEGFERETDKEFSQFLIYARGSVGELKSHLYVALDLAYLSQDRFEELHDKAVQVARLLTGFIAYLRTGRARTVDRRQLSVDCHERTGVRNSQRTNIPAYQRTSVPAG